MAQNRYLEQENNTSSPLDRIHESVFSPLLSIETKMLVGYTSEPVIKELTGPYQQKMTGVLLFLRAISEYSYAHRVAKDISNYLTDLVFMSIIQCESFSSTVMAVERWVNLLKRCFETHDFFSARAIYVALTQRSNDHSLLSIYTSQLSRFAQDILDYLKPILEDEKRLLVLQELHAKLGKPVIPVFSSGVDAYYQSIEMRVQDYTDQSNQSHFMLLKSLVEADSKRCAISHTMGDLTVSLTEKNKLDMDIISSAFCFYKTSDRFYSYKRSLMSSIVKFETSLQSAQQQDSLQSHLVFCGIIKNNSYYASDRAMYINSYIERNKSLFGRKELELLNAIKLEMNAFARYEDAQAHLEPDAKLHHLVLNSNSPTPFSLTLRRSASDTIIQVHGLFANRHNGDPVASHTPSDTESELSKVALRRSTDSSDDSK